MKVALFGGTGFVGSYLVDELIEGGHQPAVLVRPGSGDRLRQPNRCVQVSGTIGEVGAVRETIAGCDAVVYNIGILREYPNRGVTYQALHFDGAKCAMDQAVAAKVSRFILMSANGVRSDGTGYQKTKYMAEEYLKTTDLDWTIFRPSVLFGDPRGRMEFATQLYRDIIRSPLPAPAFYDGLLPLGAGGFALTPVHVQDVARVFVRALEMPETVGQTYALGGPVNMDWNTILQTIAQVAGDAKASLPVPAWMVRSVASLMDRFEWFPITADQITMLLEGNTCDAGDTFELFELEPTGFNPESLAYLRGALDNARMNNMRRHA